MGYPTRLLSTDERIVMELRPHWLELIAPTLVFVVATAVAGALVALTPDWSIRGWVQLAIGVIWLIVVLRWTVWRYLVWWLTQYAVTNRRLIIRSGVIARTGHDLPLQRINDVAFEQTWWERFLGCGTLQVESAGEMGQLRLRDIPHVEDVQRDLYELVTLDHRERRSMPERASAMDDTTENGT